MNILGIRLREIEKTDYCPNAIVMKDAADLQTGHPEPQDSVYATLEVLINHGVANGKEDTRWEEVRFEYARRNVNTPDDFPE